MSRGDDGRDGTGRRTNSGCNFHPNNRLLLTMTSLRTLNIAPLPTLAARGEPSFAEQTPPPSSSPPPHHYSRLWKLQLLGARRREEAARGGRQEGIPEPAGRSPSARWLQRRAAKVRGAAGGEAANRSGGSILPSGREPQGALGPRQQRPERGERRSPGRHGRRR